MELTNKEIFNAAKPLQEMLRERYPIQTAAAIAKLVVKLKPCIEEMETVREGLYETYGVKDSSGRASVNAMIPKLDSKGEPELGANKLPILIENPQFKLFQDAVAELMDIKIEIVLQPVTLPLKVASTCDKCHHNMDKPLEIKPETLILLEKMVKVPEK